MSTDNLRHSAVHERLDSPAEAADPENLENWDDLLADLEGVTVTPEGLRQAVEIGAAASNLTAEIAVRLSDIDEVHPYSTQGLTGEADTKNSGSDVDAELVGLLYDRTPVCDMYIPSDKKDAEVLSATKTNPHGADTPLAQVRRRIRAAMQKRHFEEEKIDDAVLAASELIDNVKENVVPDPEAPDNVGRFVCDMLLNKATGEATMVVQTFNGSTETLEGQAKKQQGQSGRGLGIITTNADRVGTYFLDKDAFTAPYGDIMCVKPEEVGLRGVWFAVHHNSSRTAEDPMRHTARVTA